VRRVILTTVALAIVAGCGQAARITPGSDDVSLDGGTWVLSEGTVDGEVLAAPPGHRISLTVAGRTPAAPLPATTTVGGSNAPATT
jgi:hypothetical protein